ncbi:MAG: GNAT family N-acetyltransferase [Spirochaetaceae bacterium]|jgi:GNAT superfamily N-acetyltransferase|nr:GNAT family N-acetyltransferase [Spirochaetaceae bacterium]
MDSVVYSEIKKTHYPEIKKILCKAFDFDENDVSPFCLRAHLSFYLHSYLRFATFRLAAEVDGRVAGFLFACAGRSVFSFCHWQDHFLFWFNALLLLFSKEGRRRLRFEKAINVCNTYLLRNKKDQFDSELLLFGVRDNMQGKGIGFGMSQRLFSWLKEHGKRRIFLFTDDVCNVEYYRANGYKLENQRELFICEPPEFRSIFYLYSKDIT